MKSSIILNQILAVLPELADRHTPGTDLHSLLKTVARKEVENLFTSESPEPVLMEPIGQLTFPYHTMGAVDSLDLFDIDELILFSFYWKNRDRYRKAVDIGANLGLHTIVLSKCGYEVTCLEPDPTHFAILEENLALNDVSPVDPRQAAVSANAGEMEFVRLIGNTTGSHLAGSRPDAYGETERYKVKVEAFTDLIADADLVKMDVEGHEAEILLNTEASHWQDTDAVIEIQSKANAEAVYEHMAKIGVNLFAQKRSWNIVNSVDDMPAGYREGLLFISCGNTMPW